MAMQINGNYDPSGSGYPERVAEKQAADRADRAREGDRTAEPKNPGKLPEPQDEYISSKKSGEKPTGLYRIGQDENGGRKIFYDDPKAARGDGKEMPGADAGRSREAADGKQPKAERNNREEPKAAGNNREEPEKCVGDTNAVEREIRKLKEKRQQLEQQIHSASGDEKKIRELEKKLAQVENELSQKDNDTYRRSHSSFTSEV